MKNICLSVLLIMVIGVGAVADNAEKPAAPLAAKACSGAFNTAWTPFQWGIFPPAQLFARDSNVYGLRLCTIYADNLSIYGIDTGVYTGARDFIGIQAAAANFCDNSGKGLQAGILNHSPESLDGAQIGLVNMAGNDDILINGRVHGAQIGYVNVTQSDTRGLQLGGVNVSQYHFMGLQLGFVNCSNSTPSGKGGSCVQIGIFNFNRNGFLPFFPIINF